MTPKRAAFVATVVGLCIALTGSAAAGTAVKPYAVSLDAATSIKPLLSVGDRVPMIGDASTEYQMIGIPDGLGATRVVDPSEPVRDALAAAKLPQGHATSLYVNHELVKTAMSEPVVGAPLTRGAFVSHYLLDADGDVVAGGLAYDEVYVENDFVGPAARADNATPGFGRLCSASLAGRESGFDRDIFLTGEEGSGSATFDGRGGQSIAIFDGEAHVLPRFGHFAKENQIVMPHTGSKTVVLILEDGPTTPDSQLYLYVGNKDPQSLTVLGRNGLDNGSLHVFAGDDASHNSEATVASGSITGTWKEIPGAAAMSESQLESAADAAGAFGFVRIEDGAFSKVTDLDAFFVTTGGNASINNLGRLYRLRFDAVEPTGPATLSVLYNADAIVAAGGDIAISPDNVDVSQSRLMINEDGTAESRSVMGSKGRDGSIWRFELTMDSDGQTVDVGSATRVAELDPPGRDGVAVGPGVWETSGIIDGTSTFGPGTWITDVQAHGPTAAPAPNTVEDGQLLLLVSGR